MLVSNFLPTAKALCLAGFVSLDCSNGSSQSVGGGSFLDFLQVAHCIAWRFGHRFRLIACLMLPVSMLGINSVRQYVFGLIDDALCLQ
jgi:hypothetical protein